MASFRWQTITKIFEAALDKPQSDRDKFVREACAGDVELEAEVCKLLMADAGAGSFLERPALSVLPSQLDPDPRASLLLPGTLISERFEILQFIGQGGMGQVYRVLDLELREHVALKAIRPEISSDPSVLSRFKREVQLTRRITHPNVCRTFDINRHTSAVANSTENEIIFLTMELLEGETLAALLRREGRLTPDDALPLVLQIIDALSAAHAVGVVHRDLKPSNVLLVPSNSGRRLVVTDFGLAHAVLPDGKASPENPANSFTGSRRLLGTPAYMAPEQLERCEATETSDIYALGLLMYEMVVGQRPFADPIPFAEALKRIKQPAPSPKLLLPELDTNWETTIGKCLQMEPTARFGRVLDVAESITGAKRGGWRLYAPQRWHKSREAVGKNRRARVAMFGKRIGSFVVCLVAVALFGLLLRHYQVTRNIKLAGGATVLMPEIQNSTGDERFDATTQLLRYQLSLSPYFNLMDAVRIHDVLTQMTKQPSTHLDPPTAREVALRTGAPRVIFGTVSRVGDRFVLDIDIEQPDNDPQRFRAHWENHWSWNMPSDGSGRDIPSVFLDTVRDSGDWIRSQIGESGSDIARVDAPPEDVTTGNWHALSEFAQAEKFKEAGQGDNAILALQNAVAADPHFALAYMRLGDVLVSLARYGEGYSAYQSALTQGRQERLTRRERNRLEGLYASDTEDFKAAEAAFHEYTVYYPNDYLGWFYRARPLMMQGRVEEAIASLEKAAEIDPSKMYAPAHLARFNLILGNFDQTSKWIQHLRDTGHIDDAELNEGQSDFLQGHYQEARDHFIRLKDSKNPLYQTYSSSLLARLYAELGQFQNALQVLNEGIRADLERGDTVHRADKLLDRAYIKFKQGHYEACLEDTKIALEQDRSMQRSLVAATLLGWAAHEARGSARSQLTRELRSIDAQLPPGEFKPFSDIVRARLRGEVLLAESRWQSALEEFRRANQLEAPTKDKEYMARGFLSVAEHTSDPTAVARLREAAFAASSVLALKPGLIWEWSQSYFPGYSSDSLLSAARIAVQSDKLDVQLRNELERYVRRRDHADPGVLEVKEAQLLLDGTTH